jgi:hypothetical protein
MALDLAIAYLKMFWMRNEYFLIDNNLYMLNEFIRGKDVYTKWRSAMQRKKEMLHVLNFII